MWAPLEVIGLFVRDLVLGLAKLLTWDAAPGLVTLEFDPFACSRARRLRSVIVSRRNAVRWLRRAIVGTAGEGSFSQSISALDNKVDTQALTVARRHVATAWREYRETFVAHDENGTTTLRNSVRPSLFFNADDLGFAPGFWRIVPGLFVTGGLFLTFLGLISALNSMDLSSVQGAKFAQHAAHNRLREVHHVVDGPFLLDRFYNCASRWYFASGG